MFAQIQAKEVDQNNHLESILCNIFLWFPMMPPAWSLRVFVISNALQIALGNYFLEVNRNRKSVIKIHQNLPTDYREQLNRYIGCNKRSVLCHVLLQLRPKTLVFYLYIPRLGTVHSKCSMHFKGGGGERLQVRSKPNIFKLSLNHNHRVQRTVFTEIAFPRQLLSVTMQ